MRLSLLGTVHAENALRDTEMVKNIADYAVRFGFGHAVFVIGAAHLQSIIEKTLERSATTIPWTESKVDRPFLERA